MTRTMESICRSIHRTTEMGADSRYRSKGITFPKQEHAQVREKCYAIRIFVRFLRLIAAIRLI